MNYSLGLFRPSDLVLYPLLPFPGQCFQASLPFISCLINPLLLQLELCNLWAGSGNQCLGFQKLQHICTQPPHPHGPTGVIILIFVNVTMSTKMSPVSDIIELYSGLFTPSHLASGILLAFLGQFYNPKWDGLDF